MKNWINYIAPEAAAARSAKGAAGRGRRRSKRAGFACAVRSSRRRESAAEVPNGESGGKRRFPRLLSKRAVSCILMENQGARPARGGIEMECRINNELGLITITEDVLLKVAGYAALECYGIVAMSSKRAKDGFVEWLGRENLTKGVELDITDQGIDIDLYIIVEYGISIVEVCNIIRSQVTYKIENMTGAKVRRVNISVEGIRV